MVRYGMSLTNPTELRQRRAQARRPVVFGILGLIMLSSCAVAGFAWGQLIAQGFETADDALSITATVAAIMAWVSFLAFTISTFSKWRLAPVCLCVALLLLGTGLAIPSVLAGNSIFNFPGLLGLAPISLALLIGLGLIRVRRVRSRRVARESNSMQSGIETTATVTNVPPGPEATSRGLWAAVTFTFTDIMGNQRWVERTMLIRRAGDVTVGETTRAWYNATNPEVDADIVIELARNNPPPYPPLTAR